MQVKFTRLEDTLPIKSYGSLIRETNGQSILLNKKREIAVNVDVLSRYIWELCDGQNTVRDISRLLCVFYPSDTDQLQSDIHDTLFQFESLGLLQPLGLDTDFDNEPRRLDLRKINFYVINCEDDVEKKEFMQKQLERLGLKFEFVSGVKCEPHPIGIALSHLKILRREDLTLPFAILEDDCQFTDNFNYIYDIPVKTDALYLGVSQYGLETDGEFGWGQLGKTRYTQITEDFLRVYNMFARHAIVYLSEKFHQGAIEGSLRALTANDYTYPGDIEYAMMQKNHLVLTPNDPVCYQSERHHGNHVVTKSSLRPSVNNLVDVHATNNMEIYRDREDCYYLFLDIFVHESGKKITALAPLYAEKVNWAEHGVSYDRIVLLFGPFAIVGKYNPGNSDSSESNISIDFEHPLLEAYIKLNPTLNIEIRIASLSKHFVLNTSPLKDLIQCDVPVNKE